MVKTASRAMSDGRVSAMRGDVLQNGDWARKPRSDFCVVGRAGSAQWEWDWEWDGDGDGDVGNDGAGMTLVAGVETCVWNLRMHLSARDGDPLIDFRSCSEAQPCACVRVKGASCWPRPNKATRPRLPASSFAPQVCAVAGPSSHGSISG
ncbi:hypothetical protein E4U42_001299 [Claviceps africana]|uniref:Uncharacterized protein n=1 Tax=Claviceps africana TaxID=83212 RepID=A0A8K0NHE4_9HYPO|nr:hypothetical protein E4U42_001299 [Claviceps africana]